MLRPIRLTLFALLLPCTAEAQHAAGTQQAPVSAPAEARQHDFLIGQWELVVKLPPAGLAQRIHGVPRLVGTWRAWRAFDGFGVEDELRITDEAGNPLSLSHALRYYDRSARTWNITVLDVYRARLTSATGEWKEGRMVQTGRGADAEGKPTLVRSRFHDITPGSFKWQQDRSSDNGKSWTEGVLRIEARRVAAAAPR
jgi:hypothetical protein